MMDELPIFATEQDEIRFVLETLDTQFDCCEDCVDPRDGSLVSNSQYDYLRKQFQKDYPDDVYFQTVTGSKRKVIRTIKLFPPMTSLSKVCGDTREEDFCNWVEKCVRELHYESARNKFSISYKRDGGGARIIYENGVYIGAAMRPRNGIDGEDITENMRYVSGVPAKLPFPISCAFTGEIECTKENFVAINEEQKKQNKKLYANPRNYAVASVRLKDATETARRGLQFVVHGVTGLANWQNYFRTSVERKDWVNGLDCGLQFVETTLWKSQNRSEDMKTMEREATSLHYIVDGAVIQVDNLEDQEQMGRHGDVSTGNPRGMVAWKFDDETAVVVVERITRQVGRTGKITPVIIFEQPAMLAGTMVSRATAHNAGYLQLHGIKPGTILKVKKSNMIIPKVVEVIANRGLYDFPCICPSCNRNTVIIGNGEKQEENCSNRLCHAQVMNTLTYYLKTIGVRGLGKQTVKLLLESRLVRSPADFYQLNASDLSGIGLTERQSLLALAAIHMVANPTATADNARLSKLIGSAMAKKKNVPFTQFFAALGIQGAGESAGKKLIAFFGNLENIQSAHIQDLEKVDDIGEITARNIFVFFNRNKDLVCSLLKHLDLELPISSGPLSGLTFVFSGSVDAEHPKEYWEKVVLQYGGATSSSVSKKMAGKGYLVAGEGSGKKTEKAKEYGVEVIGLDDLRKMVF